MSTKAVRGTVQEALPNALYRVRLTDGRSIVAGLSVDARRVTVKVLPGDQVEVVLSPFDPTRGRIVSKG